MRQDFLTKIADLDSYDFNIATQEIVRYVDGCDDFLGLLKQIGTIPECLEHDSKQEKIFSKASDAALARAFRELGLKSTVLSERGDSADVQAESIYHGYTLVADAKAFRLSRTAKNQKDFKVVALSGWRRDADFSVLCSPYFQYPVNRSQIYAQAVDYNVCLMSWEHFVFFIENGIKENETVDLSKVWNISGEYAECCVVTQKKNCFLPYINASVISFMKKTSEDFNAFLLECRDCIVNRANEETAYWESEIEKILGYSREQAIAELMKARKIDEKITQIERYVTGIKV